MKNKKEIKNVGYQKKGKTLKKTNREIRDAKRKKWIILITIWTFFLSMSINVISELFLNNHNIIMSFVILMVIIAIGIFFDMIGIAVASADLTPFNSMAANKVSGARESVNIVKNASQVSNFCNDVIGDICGIVSGATSISIIYQIGSSFDFFDSSVLIIVLNGLVAAFTVGGKAMGKNIAMQHSTKIVFRFGYLVSRLRGSFKLKNGG